MNINYEELIEEIRLKAESIYEDPNGLRDLIESAKKYIEESEIVSKVMDDLKLSVMLLTDWIDGSYREISKEAILAAIVGILFIIDPFNFKVASKVNSLGNLLVLGYLLKVIKDELEKYRSWKGSMISGDNFIEITIER